jgi:RsmE family RNA methyltransferase
VNLILADPQELDESGVLTLSDARAAHLLNVLDVAPGRDVRVGLLDGPRGIGTVTSTREHTVALRCVFEQDIPAPPRVDLLLALPRPKVMRRLWAQLAALGVGQIILTNAERVERHYFDAHTLQPEHARPLLIEGLQQARDTRLPSVSIHRQFRILIEDHLDALAGDGLRLLADPSGATPIAAAIRQRHPERLLLAVGPEGGWNDFERGLLQAHGFDLAGMGPRTLRSDTACVALLAIAHSAMASPPIS